MNAAQVEADRKEAERCQYQRGTQGVWARRWLALYQWANEEVRDRAETISHLNDEILNANEIADG